VPPSSLEPKAERKTLAGLPELACLHIVQTSAPEISLPDAAGERPCHGRQANPIVPRPAIEVISKSLRLQASEANQGGNLALCQHAHCAAGQDLVRIRNHHDVLRGQVELAKTREGSRAGKVVLVPCEGMRSLPRGHALAAAPTALVVALDFSVVKDVQEATKGGRLLYQRQSKGLDLEVEIRARLHHN